MSTQLFIKYRDGFKHIVAEDYVCQTDCRPLGDIKLRFVELTVDGKLTIKDGYGWDGTSGPVKDTKRNIRPSAGHDAKYELIRKGLLPVECKGIADREFMLECRVDGTWAWLSKVYDYVLEKCGRDATRPSSEHPILVAP